MHISAATKLTPTYQIRLKSGKNFSGSSKILADPLGVSFVVAEMGLADFWT